MIHPRAITGLREIVSQFDACFLDQFGVLHDGRKPYDGVVDALEHLHADGKILIVLTNSGKRAQPNFQRLVEIGLPAHTISGVVSSGEVAWQGIRLGRFGAPFTPQARACIVGRAGDDYGLDDLALNFVDAPEDADFLLIMGSDAPHKSKDDYETLLGQAARKAVPALCANPDKWMLSGGTLQFAPGAIAEIYQNLGGPVSFIGKPYEAIYNQAAGLCTGVSKSRILAVGDSVEHDIRGARTFGIASALVRTGVLAAAPAAELTQIFAREQASPDFLLEHFHW